MGDKRNYAGGAVLALVMLGAAAASPPLPEPLVRSFPTYPEKCFAGAKNREVVTVSFDVTARGSVDNLVVADTTNACLNAAALESVRPWVYATMPEDVVVRRGLTTLVGFEKGNSAGDLSDHTIARQLRKIERALAKSDFDIAAATSILASIETDRGAELSPFDRANFHRVRFEVRALGNDYAGALEDLMAIGRLGVAVDEAGAIAETIAALKAYVAVQAAPGEAPELGAADLNHD